MANGITVEDIKSFDYLYESMNKCKANVSWKTSVQSFLLNDIDKIQKLSESLLNGTYKERPQKFFKVYEPKERDIMSLAFVDRVYQRSLVDNLVYPQMTKSLIYDNVACQHNKGTDFGRNRLRCHMQRHFKQHGLEGYVLQLDVKGYYPNMSHKAVRDKFKRHLDKETYEEVEKILDNFKGDYGFKAGSQLIQIAGICLLDDVDHYAKEKLHIKRYIRYMDDTIIIVPTKEEAEFILHELKKEYDKVECALNLDKTKIYPLKKGITFLGFDFKLTETGKVIFVVNRKKYKRKKLKYRKMIHRVYFPVEGKSVVTIEKFEECIKAFLANLSKGNSYHIVNDFTNYIKERNEQYAKESYSKTGEIITTNGRYGA